jgi:hypothetical protein
VYVEYLVVVALLALALGGALVKVAAPMLFKRFRADQRALASPMP